MVSRGDGDSGGGGGGGDGGGACGVCVCVCVRSLFDLFVSNLRIYLTILKILVVAISYSVHTKR